MLIFTEGLLYTKHSSIYAHLIFTTAKRGRCYSYPHFMDEETEAKRGSLNNLPKVTQLVSGITKIKLRHLDFRSMFSSTCCSAF